MSTLKYYKQSAEKYRNSFEANLNSFIKRHKGASLNRLDFIKRELVLQNELFNVLDTDDEDHASIPVHLYPNRQIIWSVIQGLGVRGRELISISNKAILGFLKGELKKSKKPKLKINKKSTKSSISFNNRVFSSLDGWLLFEALLKEFEDEIKIKPLAHLSYIYWKMIEDGFLHEIKPLEFRGFIEKKPYFFVLDKIKTSSACYTKDKERVYNDCKSRTIKKK
jgi:hypothetical protein